MPWTGLLWTVGHKIPFECGATERFMPYGCVASNGSNNHTWLAKNMTERMV